MEGYESSSSSSESNSSDDLIVKEKREIEKSIADKQKKKPKNDYV